MAVQHDPDFERVCDQARQRITEVSAHEVRTRQQTGEQFLFIDIREDREWQVDHCAGATHLGRGVLERDIRSVAGDKDADIVLYCGGGFRSALAADSLERMGYSRVSSMAGGIRAWRDADFPINKPTDPAD